MISMTTLLGQLNVPQALQDLESLKLMLPKVQSESLKLHLTQGVARCEQMIREAMAQDLDLAPGEACITQLYDAFAAAKEVPADSAPEDPPLVSPNTIYWVSGIGALAILFATSVGGE